MADLAGRERLARGNSGRAMQLDRLIEMPLDDGEPFGQLAGGDLQKESGFLISLSERAAPAGGKQRLVEHDFHGGFLQS